MSALRVLAFLVLIGVCSSQTSDCSYWGLLNYLNMTTTNNALKIMRPVKNWTTITHIKLDVVLFGIIEVNEKSQTLTSHTWYEKMWQNEFLTWNSTDFCGIELFTIPRTSLWIPDLTIQEDASDTGSIQNSQLITVVSSGAVYTSGRQRLTTTCRMNLFLFPMDVQSCRITFMSMSYAGDVLKLEAARSDEILTMVSEKVMVTLGEWQLGSIKVDYDSTTQSTFPNKLVYVVTIIRKPMLYVINFIIPLFFFLVLDLASFFINEDRGEKLGFKVTILLSISVLLLILQDMLPSTEDNLPMIARYCITVFTMVGLSLLEAMLVSFLLDLDGYCGKKPQRSHNTQVEIQLEANHQVNTDAAEAEEKGPGNPVPLEQLCDHDLLKQILEEVKAARLEAGGQDEDQKRTGCYKRVAEIIDIVFFVLYLLIVLICMAYAYIVWCENCFLDKEYDGK